MRCLICERTVEENSEKNFHPSCAFKLFKVKSLPKINFSYEDVPLKAELMIGKMSISGVQPKLSVKLDETRKELEVIAKGGTHILKPSPEHFPHLAENENFCMNLAQEFGIETPPHGLLPLSDKRLVYIVIRFDRIIEKGEMKKIHVEDFAQLLQRTDKYDGSIKQIGKFLIGHSEIPFIDTQKLFRQVLFCYLIGNGDAHLKNFAMIKEENKGYRLSPAFDMVSSRLVIPSEAEEMALSINGKRNKLSLVDFKSLAAMLELSEKNLSEMLEETQILASNFDALLSNSFLPEEFKKRLRELFKKRYERLF